MTLDALISLADRILSADAGVDLLPLVDEYVSGFDLWLSGSKPQTGDEEKLRLLSDKHEAVLKRATELKGEVREGLKALKKKGIGILAYTDTLPKRLSSIKAKKF